MAFLAQNNGNGPENVKAMRSKVAQYMALIQHLEHQKVYPCSRSEAVSLTIAIKLGDHLEGLTEMLENELAMRRALSRL